MKEQRYLEKEGRKEGRKDRRKNIMGSPSCRPLSIVRFSRPVHIRQHVYIDGKGKYQVGGGP